MAIGDIFSTLLGTGGSEPGVLSGILAFIAIAGMWALIAIIVGAVAFYLAWITKYKHTVDLYIKKGGNVIQRKRDKAREITLPDSKPILELLKTKKGGSRLTTPKPAAKYTYPNNTRSNHYILWMDDNDQLHPNKIGLEPSVIQKAKSFWSKQTSKQIAEMAAERAKVMDGTLHNVPIHRADEDRKPFMKPIPHERLQWALSEGKRQQEKIEKKKKFMELLQVAGPYVAWIFSFLILYFLFSNLGGAMNANAEAMGKVAEFCQGLVS